eukprot:5555251-Amphidinium_carterae.3
MMNGVCNELRGLPPLQEFWSGSGDELALDLAVLLYNLAQQRSEAPRVATILLACDYEERIILLRREDSEISPQTFAQSLLKQMTA